MAASDKNEIPYYLEPFDRLRAGDEERLVAFLERDDLLVRGTDRSKVPPYRGGCFPYIGLVLAVTIGLMGEAWGLTRPVAIGLALTFGVLASNKLIRTFMAVQRSRRLLAEELPAWHAIAWTKDELCFRSLDRCLLAPWEAVEDVRYIDREEARLLGGTLWIHLARKEKLLIEPRTAEGLFAGRPLADWRDDIVAVWTNATGRRPSEDDTES